jgi:hypothetical protein
MSTSYVCPRCGAQDSTRCDFLRASDDRYGYPKSHEREAREAGCRVMHYHDRFARTGSYDDDKS